MKAAANLTTLIDELLPYMTAEERARFDHAAGMMVLESDWRTWVRTMFPRYVAGEFAPFHAHAWQWFWDLREGEPMEGLLIVFSRFFAKSTTVQLGLAAAGARGSRSYCLYISDTQSQANDHVQTIGSLLENTNLGDYYPDMASRKVGKHGQAKGWRRNRFWTHAGFVVDALGLDTATRGVKLEERRPDIMIFDDIDGKHDSPHETQKKIEIITNSVMPAGDASSTVYVFAQNLIHKDGVISQLVDGRLKILRNRRFYGIVPAIKNFEWKYDEDGFGKITGGEPTWDWMTLEKLQKKIDEIGIDAFLTECQHDVSRPLAGAILGEFNEIFHVITDEEFARGWLEQTGEHLRWTNDGRVQMPYLSRIGRYQDVGTTKGHPNVTSWWNRMPEISGFADYVFTHRELVFPTRWWAAEKTFEPYSVGEIAQAIYDVETHFGERHRISDADSFISHEGSSEALTYERDVPQHLSILWNKWEGDYRKMLGVSVMKNFLRVNPDKPHPFRRYPEGHPQAGEPLMGCPRMFLIVKNGQGELYVDENGDLKVRPAIDADGLRRARWEIPLYRLPEKATGEEADVPKRIDDDWISTAKAAAAILFPQPKPMSREQRVHKELAQIAPDYTEEAIEARPPEERQGARFRRDLILNDLRNKNVASKPASKLALLHELKRMK